MIVGSFSGGDGGFDFAQLAVAIEHKLQGTAFRSLHFLGHMGDAPAAGNIQAARLNGKLAEQSLEQARLAGPIAADEGDFLAGMNNRTGVFKQGLGAALQTDMFEGNHGAGLCPTCQPCVPPQIQGE